MVKKIEGHCNFKIIRDDNVISEFDEKNEILDGSAWLQEILTFCGTGTKTDNLFTPNKISVSVDSVFSSLISGDENGFRGVVTLDTDGTTILDSGNDSPKKQYEDWVQLQNFHLPTQFVGGSVSDDPDNPSEDLTAVDIEDWWHIPPNSELEQSPSYPSDNYYNNITNYTRVATKVVDLDNTGYNINTDTPGVLSITYKATIGGTNSPWYMNGVWGYINNVKLISETHEGLHVKDFTTVDFDSLVSTFAGSTPEGSGYTVNNSDKVFRLADSVDIEYTIEIHVMESLETDYLTILGNYLLGNPAFTPENHPIQIQQVGIYPDPTDFSVPLNGHKVDAEGVNIEAEKPLMLDFTDTQSGNAVEGFTYEAEEVSVSNGVPSKYKIFTSGDVGVATGDIELQMPWQPLDTVKFNYKFKINSSI